MKSLYLKQNILKISTHSLLDFVSLGAVSRLRNYDAFGFFRDEHGRHERNVCVSIRHHLRYSRKRILGPFRKNYFEPTKEQIDCDNFIRMVYLGCGSEHIRKLKLA